MAAVSVRSREIRSTISDDGSLRLDVREVDLDPPASGEITIRVEAAPINPSDIGTLLAFAELGSLHDEVGPDNVVTGQVPAVLLGELAGRFGIPMPVGNEGAGTIVAAGPGLEHLIGRTGAALAGGMFASHRTIKVESCIVLPEGTAAVEGAALFVNPLTALCMVDLFRQEGHRAIVHNPAASNLGQMLIKLCAAEGIPLINIVRKPEQAEFLRNLGAKHVIDCTTSNFEAALGESIEATGATLAFDAVGGGTVPDVVLRAMETVASRSLTSFNRYGSTEPKRYYFYGSLNTGATELGRRYGMDWSVGSFFLTSHLARIGPERSKEMQERVVKEINGIFASRFIGQISIEDLLKSETIRKVAQKATGSKYLLVP